MSDAPLVKMEGISKAFPGVQALQEAQLDLVRGEVHVLLGENGAGKSTLMKVLCGQYPADSGFMELDGQRIAPSSPHAAQQLGIGMIHQELNLVPSLTVAENIFLGHEPTRIGLFDADTMRKTSRELLGRLNAVVDPDTPVADLSVAEQQLVEIAKALREQPAVLVMDEPTAALADNEIQALFSVIRSLCASGVAIVYISHRMNEIFEIGDRITIMRDGRHVATRYLKDIDIDGLIRMMVGRTIGEQIAKREVEIGEEAVRLEGIARHGVLEPITLSLRHGEILGLGGLMGSGRTELARAIFGADLIDAGRVFIDGKQLEAGSPRAAIAAGVGFVTEDRKQHGLVLQCSVGENITLASLDKDERFSTLDLGHERTRAQALVDRLRIKIASLDQMVGNLSGGNQQKVVIAKWVAADSDVLIFDEPTRGIDVGAKAEIYNLIGELVERGVAVLLISSEMPELLGLADRIAVMHEGRLQGILDRSEATQESIMALALGQ